MQTNLTKIVLLQAWATLVFSSWAFGEKVLWGPKWIGIVALTSVVPLLIHCYDVFQRGKFL